MWVGCNNIEVTMLNHSNLLGSHELLIIGKVRDSPMVAFHALSFIAKECILNARLYVTLDKDSLLRLWWDQASYFDFEHSPSIDYYCLDFEVYYTIYLFSL